MAIAFDTATGDNVGSASSLTYAHTVAAGSDRCMILYGWWLNSRTVSSWQYAGVSATEQTAPIDAGSGERLSLYYLVAPTTGTNNVVLTLSGASSIEICSASYTGVAQTGTIDASRTETNLENGTTYSEALTTVADNCWVVWGTRNYAGGTRTAGADTALRWQQLVQFGIIYSDSNAAVTPAGSRTLNLNNSISGNWYCDILVSLAPAAGGGGTVYPRKALLGVGQ